MYEPRNVLKVLILVALYTSNYQDSEEINLSDSLYIN
jgi:hypothetical protein